MKWVICCHFLCLKELLVVFQVCYRTLLLSFFLCCKRFFSRRDQSFFWGWCFFAVFWESGSTPKTCLVYTVLGVNCWSPCWLSRGSLSGYWFSCWQGLKEARECLGLAVSSRFAGMGPAGCSFHSCKLCWLWGLNWLEWMFQIQTAVCATVDAENACKAALGLVETSLGGMLFNETVPS